MQNLKTNICYSFSNCNKDKKKIENKYFNVKRTEQKAETSISTESESRKHKHFNVKRKKCLSQKTNRNGNNKTAVFPVSIAFKLFEDCSFSVSIVLKYLFLYSNIFRLCTAVLHSKYLLHIYIQIFVNSNGFAFDSG